MLSRRRTHEVLDAVNPGDRVALVFNYGMLALIALNVIALVLETVQPIYARSPAFFDGFELVSVIVFSTEYVARLWACVENPRFAGAIVGRIKFIFSPMGLIDLLAVVPFYLPAMGMDLRSIRVVRLMRLFRLAKLGRYSSVLQLFGRVCWSKRAELLMVSALAFVLLILAASVVYFAENDAQPQAFSSIPATMWWAVAALTTVGYGDVYPVTAHGKFVASFLTLLGIALFALPTGVLAAAFVEEVQARRAPRKRCPHCDGEI